MEPHVLVTVFTTLCHPGGHDQGPVVLHFARVVDLVLTLAEVESGLPLLQAQELVEVVVGFPADLPARGMDPTTLRAEVRALMVVQDAEALRLAAT